MDDGLAEWSMAQYLDNIESSDQVHDISSFQDVNLDSVEKGGQASSNKHSREQSADSFASHGSSSSSTNPRRARKMYYFLPMIWKHRYPIAACASTVLVFIIAISVTVSSISASSKGSNNWKANEPIVKVPPSSIKTDEDGVEMVGPPLQISPNTEDDQDGAMVVGPGESTYQESSSSYSTNRTPCMTATECEARSDLLGFPNFTEGNFSTKGCYFEGSTVFWGMGSTTTNDDEEENDLTIEELSSKLSSNGNGLGGKVRLFCDTDKNLIAIDQAAADLSIGKGGGSGGSSSNTAVQSDSNTSNGDEVIMFEEEDETVNEEGVMIVGANTGMNSTNENEGVMVVGSPVQIESNTDESDIDAEWFQTDEALYISFIVDGLDPHKMAMKFCKSKSKSLCTYNQYCPGGKSSRVYQGGPDGTWVDDPAESEQWAPVLTHSTDSVSQQWVQIGKIVDGGDASENYGQCWRYEDWMNQVDSSMNAEDMIDESHRRFFLCCG